MKRFLLLMAFASSSVFMKPVLADPAPKHHEDDRDEEKEGKHGKHGHEKDKDDRYFRPDDRQIIVNHYGGIQNLPPGLRKKYIRTGTLPSGWQKRVQPFPVELDRRLAPICPTCRRGIIDRHGVVYDERTGAILDVLPLRGR